MGGALSHTILEAYKWVGRELSPNHLGSDVGFESFVDLTWPCCSVAITLLENGFFHIQCQTTPVFEAATIQGPSESDSFLGVMARAED